MNNPKYGMQTGQARFSMTHAPDALVLTIGEEPDADGKAPADAIFSLAKSQLPNVMYAMAGGVRDETDMMTAQLEIQRIRAGETTVESIGKQARSLLLTAALLQEEQDAELMMDAEILDEIDDMSRAEAIALAKELRDATTPYAMARWAHANADLVAQLNQREADAEAELARLNAGRGPEGRVCGC